MVVKDLLGKAWRRAPRSDNPPALLICALLTDEAREVRFELTTRAATP
jgi:hypothetical protein